MSAAEDTTQSSIPGYDFDTSRSALSPVSEVELAQLEQTAGWTAAHAETLARHAGLFRAKAESMVDSWRAVIGSQPHLAHWFVKPDGEPDDAYKAGVRRRFVQWVIDVALRPHDRDWLNYQQEIGLRHTPAKKNKTDGAHTPPVVPFRYLLSFVPVVLPSVISSPIPFPMRPISSGLKMPGPRLFCFTSHCGPDPMSPKICGEKTFCSLITVVQDSVSESPANS